MIYQPTWDSLAQHSTPQWFSDAKFGIYTHWGVYSVPACGPNASLYFYNMYSKGTPQNLHHVQRFGGPERFGYKDFIPMFKAEQFDADEWAELFRQSGARFAGPVAEHHDGFSMWDTKYSRWNAANMGPKRDVVGELEKAIRKQNIKFLTAFHHAENWFAYPHWVKEYDTSDPQYQDFYGEQHNTDWPGTEAVESWVPQISAWFRMQRPSRAFLKKWFGKVKEVIDNYSPDMLWFDFGLSFQGDVLYAICLSWPGEEAVITTAVKSASTLYPSEIKSITMLGVEGELPWRMADDGLRIAVPSQKPCDHAFVFKIERKHPFLT